ncbi:caspase domain containing protein [Nitzschia inconspicua]|uniref:Caspase domain containing protein n=1 Tax=Nitzschia inconspicua TaxID=303405 RepID=A0A9K3KPF5_9STRA|nr:caspase domain containing protein [Nitzschia inconspicua]
MDEKIQHCIPAKFVMISGSEDKQTSADVSNVNSFQLPDPHGKAGGACTSTLLRVLHDQGNRPLSWIDLLHKMRDVLKQKGFDQIPQLSSSRMLDVSHAFEIVPPESKNGARRAVLIGINYVGQQGELSGCHNDVHNIKKYLIKHQGFQEKDMLVLMDDGRHHQPTHANIMNALDRVTKYSKAGDVVFIHFSGHGGRVVDVSGDEADGYDETMIPVDFKKAGQILDDELYDHVVKRMAAGVTVTVLMDCCHSGSALDLPYEINATQSAMKLNPGFNMNLLDDPAALICCAICAYCLFQDLLGSFFDG